MTVTNAAAIGYSSQRKIDRTTNGNILVCYADTVTNGTFRVSTDDGVTWTNPAMDIVGFVNGSLFLDADDFLHVVWKQSGTGGGRNDGWIYYLRGTPNSDRTVWTWGTVTSLRENTTGDYPDVVAHREGTGWKAQIVFSVAASTPENYAFYIRVNITSAAVVSVEQDDFLLGGSYGTNIHSFPSIDFNHTGDGKTVANGLPHVYVGWTAGATGSGKGIRFRKAVYAGGSWTWNTEREIDNTIYVDGTNRWINCFFDGIAVIIGGMFTDGSSGGIFRIWERDVADATTTLLGGYTASTGSDFLYRGSLTYDQVTRDLYMLGETPNAPYQGISYKKYTRSTATFDAGKTITDQTNDTSAFDYVSTKRGGRARGRNIEWVYAVGNNTPYAVKLDRVKLAADKADVVMGGGYG